MLYVFIRRIEQTESGEMVTEKTSAKFVKLSGAYMVEGAKFVGDYDIPKCPSTATNPPSSLVAYSDIKKGVTYDAFAHFYIDDYKFDGLRGGIWNNPELTLKKLRQCKGAITPDFSTYQDMPGALKIYNTYRMRAFGFWLTKQGIDVINNVRWGTPETYSYCFDGISKNSIVSIGTVGCIKEKCNWRRFADGLEEMIHRLCPSKVMVYGSAPNKFFAKYREAGIPIIDYPSKTSLVFSEKVRA